jgi:hypothetical protein
MDRKKIQKPNPPESSRMEINQPQRELARTQRLCPSVVLCRKVVVAALILQLTPVLSAHEHKKPGPPAAPSDPGYLFALAAANRFLHAWETGDLAEGMVLVSDGVRHSQNADSLENFFSAATDRAFEIRTGRGNHGRYSFPVVLIHLQGSGITRKSSEMILVNTGKNDWAVDKLP